MNTTCDRRISRRGGSGILLALVCAGTLSALTPQAAAIPRTGAASSGNAECTAPTGPYQRQLEEFLELPVDGSQSAQDCSAIREFQRRQKLSRQDGYAGLEAYRQTQLVRAGKNPNADGSCPVDIGRVVCVGFGTLPSTRSNRSSAAIRPISSAGTCTVVSPGVVSRDTPKSS